MKMQRKGVCSRNERGAAGIKAVIAFVILAALIYSAIKIVPIYAAHWKFEDDVKNNLLFANERYRNVEGGIEKRLPIEISAMLDGMGAKYDKKNIRVKVDDQKKINVEVWYERATGLPFVQKLQFHSALENTVVKGL